MDVTLTRSGSKESSRNVNVSGCYSVPRKIIMNKKIVLSLKYRPKNFDEIIGQETMVISLKSALRKNKIHNAYILTGIRGVGKTTTARVIAKAINCNKHFEHGATDTSDTYCCCDEISSSSHIDVLEMDAASKTGVDDIRDLLESSKYHPSVAKYKVFIIDEAHMLSKQAFNALLKTLEEPPQHLKFILATTEIKKIPITILSRCHRFDLKRIGIDQMTKFLNKISKQENIKIDTPTLQLISKSSEGSVRDALSILDQANIMNNSEQQIVSEDVRKMLGLADKEQILNLLEKIILGDDNSSIKILEDIFNYGSDPKLILESLLEQVYLISREQSIGNISSDISIAEQDISKIKELASKIDLTFSSILWHYLIKGFEDLKLFPDNYIAIQMLTIRLCRLKSMPDPQKIINDENLQNEIIIKNELNVKTQIKNVVQEKKETLTKKDNKIVNFISKINNFDDLIDIVKKNKEVELKFDLERHVKIVNFQQGKIDISFNEKLSKNFIKNLTEKLRIWTGKRWIISFNKLEGDKTIFEQKTKKNLADLNRIKQTNTYKKILDTFDDAIFINSNSEEEK